MLQHYWTKGAAFIQRGGGDQSYPVQTSHLKNVGVTVHCGTAVLKRALFVLETNKRVLQLERTPVFTCIPVTADTRDERPVKTAAGQEREEQDKGTSTPS